MTPLAITSPMTPPTWALLERELMRAQATACEEFYTRYFDGRGYLLCIPRWGGNDGPDDAIENLTGWSLLHTLGGSQQILDHYKQAWEGHLLQYTEAKTEVVPDINPGRSSCHHLPQDQVGVMGRFLIQRKNQSVIDLRFPQKMEPILQRARHGFLVAYDRSRGLPNRNQPNHTGALVFPVSPGIGLLIGVQRGLLITPKGSLRNPALQCPAGRLVIAVRDQMGHIEGTSPQVFQAQGVGDLVVGLGYDIVQFPHDLWVEPVTSKSIQSGHRLLIVPPAGWH